MGADGPRVVAAPRPGWQARGVRVLLAGASGVVGRPLLPRLLAAGHEVVAVARRPVPGVETVVADVVTDPLRLPAVDAVVVELTALPRSLGPGARRGFPENDRVREVGVPRLLDAAGCPRVVVQSMLALAGADGPPAVRRAARALAVMEDAAAARPEGVVLRHGLLLGPGTWYDEGGAYARLARRGALPLAGDGSPRSAYVHVDDAAEAAVVALTAPPGTYEVAGEPVAARELWTAFAARTGARAPRALPRPVLAAAAGAYAAWFATTDRPPGAVGRLPGWEPRVPWRDALPGA